MPSSPAGSAAVCGPKRFCPSVVDIMPHPPPFDPSLIAFNISGDLGGYTFYTNRNRKTVAYPARPALCPPSDPQKQLRGRFAVAMLAWKALPLADQSAYNECCDSLCLCMWGANLFTYLALTDPGVLRETLSKQLDISLTPPPPLTEGNMAVPGPGPTAVAAWIAQKYGTP